MTKIIKLKKQRDVAKCGLCGKKGKLTRTECCGQWICDDGDEYVPFSYARNSCYRNHSSFTLCSHHYNEGHFDTEMYVYYGTNEYNFEKLEDPPDYEPTRCSECGAAIVLSEGGYLRDKDGYKCGKCTVY